jgi:hypothetical protein
MIQRWLTTAAFFYPAFLLAMLWMVALPATALGVENWEVLPLGILPQSADLIQLSSQTIFIASTGLLALACFIARTAGTPLFLSCASLIPLPYWIFALRDGQIEGAGGLLIAFAGLVESQRNLNTESYWKRLVEAWAPPAIGAILAGLVAFGTDLWYAGAFAAVPLAASATIAAAFPRTAALSPGAKYWPVVVGIGLTLLCRASLTNARDYQLESRHARAIEQLRQLPEESPRAYEKYFFQRGVSLVADRAGYGSGTTLNLLQQLKPFGVDSIAIVIHGITPRANGERESDAEIELLTRRAHSLGMKVMLKPHHRPRDSDLASAPARAAWFAKHAAGIEHFGKLAARIHADLFCVGYEMGDAYQYEAEWRAVVARARAAYPGPLTACPSQGKQFEEIRFWDALDYIGIDNYYPLGDDYDYSKVVEKIERVQKQFGKPVLFTEAGFASVEASHREPWAEPRRQLSLEEQTRCYRALLSAVYDKPWFMGVYWWKLDTDGMGGPDDRSLTPWRKPAMDLVKAWYTKERRSR